MKLKGSHQKQQYKKITRYSCTFSWKNSPSLPQRQSQSSTSSRLTLFYLISNNIIHHFIINLV